jgi:hypothetical protein
MSVKNYSTRQGTAMRKSVDQIYSAWAFLIQSECWNTAPSQSQHGTFYSHTKSALMKINA